WVGAGNPPPQRGNYLTSVCDRVDCIAPEHRREMTKAESREANSARITHILNKMGKDEASDLVFGGSVRISDGHTVLKDGSTYLTLSGGRKAGAARVMKWVMDDLDELPQSVTRTCDYEGCVSAKHLEVTKA